MEDKATDLVFIAGVTDNVNVEDALVAGTVGRVVQLRIIGHIVAVGGFGDHVTEDTRLREGYVGEINADRLYDGFLAGINGHTVDRGNGGIAGSEHRIADGRCAGHAGVGARSKNCH